jgi:diamine N-acetyltransferase
MERDDLERVWTWENDSAHWWMGATNLPISQEAMKAFVAGNHDIYRDRQLRWMLDANTADGWTCVGAMDLYDFEPRHLRAGVGVHIDANHRQQGHGAAGLHLLSTYGKQHLGLTQLYAEVPASHPASLALFQRAGFETTGVRKAWIRGPRGWEDVVTVQQFFDPAP